LQASLARRFEMVYADSEGAGNLTHVYLLAAPELSSPNPCWLYYHNPTNTLWLFNDQISGVLGPLTPGGDGSVENSQCRLNAKNSFVTRIGTRLTLTIELALKMTGTIKLFLLAQNGAGTSGWIEKGSNPVVSPFVTELSVTPNAGNTAASVFTVNLKRSQADAIPILLELLFSGGLPDGGGGCLVKYYALTNRFEVTLDSGAAGPTLPAGQPGILQNSQCQLDVGASSVVQNGNDYRMDVTLAFNPSFVGPKTIFLRAFSNGLTTPWMAAGAWTVPGAASAPRAISSTPIDGTGQHRTFTFTYSDPAGFQNLTAVHALINTNLSGVNGCWFYYDASTNFLWLYNDNVTGVIGPLTPGTPGSIQNSRCTLFGDGTTVAGSGNTLTINARLRFSNIIGLVHFYLLAQNALGQSGWVPAGRWTPQERGVPEVKMASPVSGAGLNAVIQAHFNDVDGYLDLTQNHVLINSTLNGAGACWFYYHQPTNRLWLFNDTVTGVLGPLTPGGAGTVENSQCQLHAAGSIVGTGVQNLVLIAQLTFKPAFAGDKNVYLLSQNDFQSSGWVLSALWGVR
jgi:hypothetical protein